MNDECTTINRILFLRNQLVKRRKCLHYLFIFKSLINVSVQEWREKNSKILLCFLDPIFLYHSLKSISYISDNWINRVTAVLEIYVNHLREDASQICFLVCIFFFFFFPLPHREMTYSSALSWKEKEEKREEERRRKEKSRIPKDVHCIIPFGGYNFAIIIDYNFRFASYTILNIEFLQKIF